jgi:hypothetical protein
MYNMYRVYFPGVKRPGRGADHHHHLAPRLKEERSYISVGLYGRIQGENYLSLLRQNISGMSKSIAIQLAFLSVSNHRHCRLLVFFLLFALNGMLTALPSNGFCQVYAVVFS